MTRYELALIVFYIYIQISVSLAAKEYLKKERNIETEKRREGSETVKNLVEITGTDNCAKNSKDWLREINR